MEDDRESLGRVRRTALPRFKWSVGCVDGKDKEYALSLDPRHSQNFLWTSRTRGSAKGDRSSSLLLVTHIQSLFPTPRTRLTSLTLTLSIFGPVYHISYITLKGAAVSEQRTHAKAIPRAHGFTPVAESRTGRGPPKVTRFRQPVLMSLAVKLIILCLAREKS